MKRNEKSRRSFRVCVRTITPKSSPVGTPIFSHEHPVLLLVQGDPVANINLIETPETDLVVIMKDGKICKNLLP